MELMGLSEIGDGKAIRDVHWTWSRLGDGHCVPGKAGANPLLRRYIAGQRAGLRRVCTGFAPALVRIQSQSTA